LSKFFKSNTYFFVIFGSVSLGAALFIGQAAIAKQMNDWQLLPRPQRFTELYFTNRALPPVLKRGTNQKIAFTLHNLEHEFINYHYALVAVSDKDSQEQPLAKGNVGLAYDQSKSINQLITAPKFGTRLAIRVNLEYDGIAFGADKPGPEKQSIQFWTKLTDGAAHAGK
jgi:hypothetical protein